MPNKLTIITINRNNAEGLKKTIGSVLLQSYNAVEFIIVDGASTDESLDVILQYKDIKHYSWISEPDSGVYEAMNKGIRAANGEYLLFLNSGDFLVDSKVLHDVFSVNHHADILCGRCQVSRNGITVWTSNPPNNITFGTLYYDGLSHQSTFIKRSLFYSLGMYREDYKYNSDIDFWYRSIILNGASTEKLDVLIADYNLDGISSKENQTDQYQREMSEILSQANFHKFTPDYKFWDNERKLMEVYYWAKQKRIVNLFIQLMFQVAVWFNKNKQK
jgi:glycosyltransferase involved in cell wall biosynthesis